MCGVVLRRLLNFLISFTGESVVDFMRGDFPVARTVAGDARITWHLVPDYTGVIPFHFHISVLYLEVIVKTYF